MSVEEIGKEFGVDSIGYLSLDAMLSMHSLPKEDFCVACFSGKYPTKIENNNCNGKLSNEPRKDLKLQEENDESTIHKPHKLKVKA